MKQTDSITGGIHQLLYGRLRAGEVLERYENSDGQLCHTLYNIPASPALYLESNEVILNRWTARLDEERKEKWIASWYRMPDSEPESFHILCEFYRSYIYCECRMMIQSIESWIEDISFDTVVLKYEIALIHGDVIELLRECGKRISENSECSTSVVERLTSYLLELLKNNLLMSFFELQKRYGHLLEERLISEKELHLKYLKQPVPNRYSWYATTDLTKAELELASRPPETLRKIEDLLQRYKKSLRQHTQESAQQEMYNSIHILENAWLCACLYKNNSIETEIDVAGPEENAGRINRWISYLTGYKEPEEDGKQIIETLLHQIPEIKAVINTERTENFSEAVQLIKKLETIFSLPKNAERRSFSEVESSQAIHDEEHWLLKLYISFEQIRAKFQITDKSLKKYLSESQTQVIQLTAKNRWLHVNDFQTFMNSHRKTY